MAVVMTQAHYSLGHRKPPGHRFLFTGGKSEQIKVERLRLNLI